MQFLNAVYIAPKPSDSLRQTIGDAYMVVGNLPIAGQKWPAVDHAARVARFALDAMSAARQVRSWPVMLYMSGHIHLYR